MLQRLNNPQKNFSSIHVAGTNGKGSLCAHLSAIGSKNKVLIGFFSSPHLIIVEERIRVDGRPVSAEIFDKCLLSVYQASLMKPIIQPTFFEITFLTSLLAFSEAEVDVAIIETGLGGRLDCTRLVEAEICAITTISKDHSEILGDTLVKIASEKAAIYRQNKPLFSLYHPDQEVREVFTKTAGSDLIWFSPKSKNAWQISREFAIIIADYLGWSIGNYELDWPGRSEDKITWIPEIRCRVSAAHNVESIENELNLIENEVVMIIGMSYKTNLKETMSPFNSREKISYTIITEPQKGRKPPVSSEEIQNQLKELNYTKLEKINNPGEALLRAEIIAKELNCTVLIIGSIYLVGEIMNYVITRDSLDLYDILTIHPPLK
jgi:folylpolyglutamate synthase/dihydropteroate synthase